MDSERVFVREWPAPSVHRDGLLAHPAMLGAGGAEALERMLKGRGLEGRQTQSAGSDLEAFARMAASSRVLIIPRMDDTPMSEEGRNALAVALALGLPVVSSGRGGLSEWLTHGHEGYVAGRRHDLPEDLAPAAAKIMKDEVLFARFSRGAMARVKVVLEGNGARLEWTNV